MRRLLLSGGSASGPDGAICHLVKPSLTIETQNPQLMKTATAVVLSNGWAALLLALASGLRRGWRFLLRSAAIRSYVPDLRDRLLFPPALVTSGHSPWGLTFRLSSPGWLRSKNPK